MGPLVTIFVVIPGILAALVLFRWARTLALFGMAALALWVWASHGP
jgi:hypothetical protein